MHISEESKKLVFNSFFPPSRTFSNETPIVYCTSRIPASGKSTFIDFAISKGWISGDIFILDPDRVMQALPEYQEMLTSQGAEVAFKTWEMPAREFAYELFDYAKENRLPIIIDMGFSREEEYKRLSDLKALSYIIEFNYIFCPPVEAIRRTHIRERHTPEQLIWDRYKALETFLPRYSDLAHRFRVFDNSDLATPFRQTNDHRKGTEWLFSATP